ncbi:MAG: Ig-like domain-containing protein, partial [Candidatus Peribacteraceae bacterium]|nr:Ig-like domain-containing protein [Candidatus Peribacteraceae bacterium]
MSIAQRISSTFRGSFALAAVIVITITVLGLVFTGILRFPQWSPSMDFSLRQKVSATSELRFSFPSLMEHASAQENLKAPEGLKGTWNWKDDTLTFKPAEKLKAGKEYVFRLNGRALKSDGRVLGRDLDFTFIVAGPVKLSARIPAENAKNVPTTSTITLVFDRPMIPLTQVQGDAANARIKDWTATISPETKGRWRWLSTVAVVFVPEQPLLPSTLYTVTVPKGIPTVAGDATESDFSWKFETNRPQVVSTDPIKGYASAGPTTQIAVTFNQEMDPAAMVKSISLSKVSEDQNPVPVTIRPVEYGTKEVDKKKIIDRKTLVIAPVVPFEFSSSYTLSIAKGFKGAQGDLENGTGFSLLFSTVGPLKVMNPKYEYGSITIRFNNPVNEDSLKDQITISPAVENWKDVEWNVAGWNDNKQISAYPSLKPSTTYTLTLSPKIADSFGQHLSEPFTYSFRTDPLHPQVRLDSRGEFGIFERGKPPVYYLKSVNVSPPEAELAKVELPDFLAYRNQGYNRGPVASVRTILKSWTVDTKGGQDVWNTTELDLQKIADQSLGSGIYELSVQVPDNLRPEKQRLNSTQFFALTDIALTLKYSGNRALVWAVNMQTGEPVKGAAVNFHALNGETVSGGSTDKDGFFGTEIDMKKFTTPMNEWEPEFWVTAEKGDDFAFVSSRWNDGIRPDSFGFMTDFWNEPRNERPSSFLYTERPLYRAGDTVFYKGLVRMRDRNGRLSVPGADRTVNIVITDANGNEVTKKSLPFNEFGSFSDSFPLDIKASLGYYAINATLADSTYPEIYGSFQVLAYRKPEYRVEVMPEKEDAFNGDTIKATIEGAYYFGAPMSNAPVTWRVQTTDYFFNKYTDGWYSFALEDSWCWWNCERSTDIVAQGEGMLDASGHLTVSVPAKIDDKSVSQIYTIEADITDPNNQVVSNRGSVAVHKAATYVGVRAEDYVVTPGSNAKIGIVTVTPDGKPLPKTDVTLSLYSRTWNTVKKKGVDGEYYYDNTPEDIFLKSSSATTDERGKTTAEVKIDKGGQFVVVAGVKDDQGRETKASTSIYAWSSSYVNWPHSNNDRIDLLADKPEYAVGDTATLLLKSPYQGKGVKALVTIEREQVMQKSIIDITSSAQAIRIPVTEDMIPNAYVSVTVIKPRMGETFDDNGLDTGAPAFRIGYAKLNVETKKKRLAVTVTPDKEQYLPGEKVKVNIKTLDWQGKPVPAEVSLGVVDMSLLALTGFSLPDPVAMFYSERGLGVYTAEMLKFLIERYKPGSKGGGGADLEAKKRGDFKDTAYWNPTVVTNENGEAAVSFKLPDNLTTWHFLAIGQTKDAIFGAAEKTVVETKRVIVRPVRPRFAVQGDRIELGAIVHNFFPDDQTFTVTLTGSGFTSASKLTQNVTIKSGAMQKLIFHVLIRSVDKATFIFKADTGTARDEIEESIPVFTYGTPQSAATTGITDTVSLEKVLVPSGEDAKDGSLSVTVSPSLATYLTKGLDYLVKFPYGCAEQTLSSILPSVALTRLQGFDAFKVVDDKTLRSIVTKGLERLYTLQRGDGGFGYWQESDRSSVALSAYALQALTLIRDAGFGVDGSSVDRVRTFLDERLRSEDAKEPLSLATRAAVLSALSESGKVDVSLLKNLDQNRGKLPIFAKAQLAMAFQKEGQKAKASDILSDILNTAL